jgi:hypothetical protein
MSSSPDASPYFIVWGHIQIALCSPLTFASGNLARISYLP